MVELQKQPKVLECKFPRHKESSFPNLLPWSEVFLPLFDFFKLSLFLLFQFLSFLLHQSFSLLILNATKKYKNINKDFHRTGNFLMKLKDVLQFKEKEEVYSVPQSIHCTCLIPHIGKVCTVPSN